MAVRVHVLRTCDRCGRPIETDGAVPVKQLKEGDVIPTFHRALLRVIREEPSMEEGGAPTVKVLGTFSDTCPTCENVIERAIHTLLRQSDSDDATSPQEAGESTDTPRRRRAGSKPRQVSPDMPGPNGEVPAAAATESTAAPASETLPETATTEPATAGATDAPDAAGAETDHPF